MRRNNLVGEVHGRLTVMEYVGTDNYRDSLWRCLCSCGTVIIVRRKSMVTGNTKSCGCLRSEMVADKNTVHGLAGTPEYVAWCAMRYRCNNSNGSDWDNYGGRGIRCCERWKSFENFLQDVGPKPSPEHSL